jgi:hypothetical protein
MATAIRLDGLSRHPRLARFGALSVDWWLIRADPSGGAAGADRTVPRTTSRLVSSGGDSSGTWVARIDGARGAIQYAVAVVPGAVHTLGAGARAGHRVLSGLDDLQARSLLDAAETVSVAVVLLRTAVRDAPAVADALAGDDVVPASLPCTAAVIKPAEAGWSVFGARPGALPPPVPGLHIVEQGMDSMPVEAGGDGDHPRGRFGMRSVALGSAAVIVVLGATAGIWRLEHGPAALPARTVSHGAAGESCTVWTLEAPGVAPSTSGGAAIAQDGWESGSPVVLFGGVGNESKTWLWSELDQHQRWALAQPSVSPPGRSHAALAYDPTVHDLVLFGGVLSNGHPANDTWVWNGCTWKRDRQQGDGPPGGRTAGMVWDNALNRMVLLTYDTAAGPEATQTWTWNGSDWSLSASAGASPRARALVTAGDPVTEWPIAVSLTSSSTEPDGPSSTWTWDGTTWQTVTTLHSPQVGSPAAIAVDPQTNQLVLTGPARQPGGSSNQTWTWDGTDWSLLQPSGAGAPIAAGAVDDSADGVVEAFGWAAAPTASRPLHVWALTGGDSWVRVVDGTEGAIITGAGRPPLGSTSTAYDGAHHQLVAFGGSGRSALDTWTFDGNTWKRHATSARPPALGPMVYDPFSRTVILVANAENTARPAGGNQTWVWNGSTWRLLKPRSNLTPLGYALDLVADPADRTIVALMTCCGSGVQASLRTWTWNGSTWTLQHPSQELPGSLEFVTAYDPTSHEVIALGNGGSVGPGFTWAWDGRTWTQPKLRSGATFDPLTSQMTTDSRDAAIVLVSTVAGNEGTAVWSGSSWTMYVGLIPIGATTGSSVAALYYDDSIGNVVLLGGAGDFVDQEWMWTSADWLQLDPTPLSDTAG